jgi:hypothetical protein
MSLQHLDLRAWANGGPVAASVAIFDDDGTRLDEPTFASRISGKHLVLVTHGFNVKAEDGIVALEGWKQLAALKDPCVYVGLLWPGDSLFLPVLDYPIEGSVAMQSAALLAQFLNANAGSVTAISMVSHSLGARLVLETAKRLGPARVDTMLLMAGAIEDDCFVDEYKDVAAAAKRLCVVASRRDKVLEYAFPVGDPIGELVARGHPYFRQALGRDGAHPAPSGGAGLQHWQIPDAPSDWDYGHLDYMPHDPLPVGRKRSLTVPLPVPSSSDPKPVGDGFIDNEWAAAVIATQWPNNWTVG